MIWGNNNNLLKKKSSSKKCDRQKKKNSKQSEILIWLIKNDNVMMIMWFQSFVHNNRTVKIWYRNSSGSH